MGPESHTTGVLIRRGRDIRDIFLCEKAERKGHEGHREKVAICKTVKRGLNTN